MVKWKVSLTVEKIIEAENRKTAKDMLVKETQHSKLGPLGIVCPVFSLCDRNDLPDSLPVLIDVSASKVKEKPDVCATEKQPEEAQ